MIKSRTNLLLWYTADEPDGTSNTLSSTSSAYDLIYSLDGYHPVSLALNCADYEFTAYTAGADIVMPSTYVIGNNVSFSSKYRTECTPEFGCCGCDNCLGEFEDIPRRLDDFKRRLAVIGWERTKVVWAVTQAFGGEELVLTRKCFQRIWLAYCPLALDSGTVPPQGGNGLSKPFSVLTTVLSVTLLSIHSLYPHSCGPTMS